MQTLIRANFKILEVLLIFSKIYTKRFTTLAALKLISWKETKKYKFIIFYVTIQYFKILVFRSNDIDKIRKVIESLCRKLKFSNFRLQRYKAGLKKNIINTKKTILFMPYTFVTSFGTLWLPSFISIHAP